MAYCYGVVSDSERAGHPVPKPHGAFETENPIPIISSIVRNEDTKFGVGIARDGTLGGLTKEGKLYGVSTFDVYESVGQMAHYYKKPMNYFPEGDQIGIMIKGAIWVNIKSGCIQSGERVGINENGEFGHTGVPEFKEIKNVVVEIGNKKSGSVALLSILP